MAQALSPAKTKRLIAAARVAARQAYAPYSCFPVGAAVLAGSGRVFTGANVENACLGLGVCAERTAIFAAVAAGERQIRAVALYTATPHPVGPCGACRQVIHEFGPDAHVVAVCDSAERLESSIAALLPNAFGPADLLKSPKCVRPKSSS
jgi:cytidine deaminase